MKTGSRIEFLDVLRGVAILGILPVNAAFFAYPVGIADHLDVASVSTADTYAWWFVRLFFEYKFITLFAFLFGAGMTLMWRKWQPASADESPPPPAAFGAYTSVMVRRLGTLLVFGLMHAWLIWYGDIVAIYGGLGLTVFWFARHAPRHLLTAGLIGVALPALCCGGISALSFASPEIGAGFAETQALDGEFDEGVHGSFTEQLRAVSQMDPDIEVELYGNGTFGEITLLRQITWIYMLTFAVMYFGPRLIGLFLLGMAFVGAGWPIDTADPRARRLYRWLLYVGLPLGFALEVTSAWITAFPEGDSATVVAEFLHQVGSLGMSGGYLALIALLTGASPGLLLRPFAAVGRMAFTNYIGQSLIMTTIFYSYGFGYFGSPSRTDLLLICACVWTTQLVLSPLWMQWFRMGPLEWLWRSATYWEFPPLLRTR